MSGQWTRRGLLRQGAAAAASVGAVGALAACAKTAAQAVVQTPTTILQLRPWGGGGGSGAMGTAATIDRLLQAALQPWLDQHKGVAVKIVPNNSLQSDVLTPLIAGGGPDVYHSWHPQTVFSDPDFTVDLTSFIKQSNVDLTIFSKAQMDLFRLPSGIRALPCYLGVHAVAVNEALLDSMGLAYPEPGWDYNAFASLATRIHATPVKGKRVPGTDWILGGLGANAGTLPPAAILAGFGGRYVDAADPTKCALDSTGSVQATRWAYGLQRSGAEGGISFPGGFAAAQGGMTWAPSYFLPQQATTWTGFKWSYYMNPSFPKTGPVTGATEDLYAMNPNTKNQELAWSLMQFLCVEPTWQRSMMDIFLLSPALNSLWEEWIARVKGDAPPLAQKNLAVFATLATSGHAYPQEFFRYEAPAADAIISHWGSQINSRSVGIQTGLTQATSQVDALEKNASAEQASLTQLSKKNVTNYTAPPEKGAGDPFTDASKWILEKNGIVTMLGDGYDVYNAEDACTFYCAADTRAKASYVCRVTGVANVSCPSISGWVKLGLMARGDLSDDAPMVSIHVTGANNIEWQNRSMPGVTPAGTSGLRPTGLKGAMMSSLTTPTPNYMVQAIWLRMDRDGAFWTAYSSLDGSKWTQMGAKQACQMAGCWVGINCLAHNSDFNDKGYIRGTFDHVDTFSPALSKKVQLGVDGVYPAAGPVPADWATMVPSKSASSTSKSASSGSKSA